MIFFIFFIFYLFWQLKQTLFWLYLWQLKEYHLGRLRAHFSTYQGRQLIFDKEKIAKILSLFLLYYSFFYGFIFLFFLYLFEFLFLFLKKRKINIPVWTIKTIFLFLGFFFLQSIIFCLFFLKSSFNFFIFFLVTWDILLPILLSFFIILFQPVSFFWRVYYLQKAKKKINKKKGLIVIAIVGSYGKTTTKEFLARILEKKFKVLKTKEHQNSEIAISKMILNDLNDQQVLIVEMGAYNKGQIRLLCNIVKPSIGIITGVNEQHLATFGSLENLISAEGGGELIDFLEKNNGLVIFNGNNSICLENFLKTTAKKMIVFAKYPFLKQGFQDSINFDFLAQNVSIKESEIAFEVKTKNNEKTFLKLNLIGHHHIENLLLAMAGAQAVGMNFSEIISSLSNIKSDECALKLRKTKSGIFLLDATYSANPESVISHLDYLSFWPGKKILIFSSLIELGKKASEIHEKIGEKMGEVCDFIIFLTKDYIDQMRQKIESKGLKGENVIFLNDKDKILTILRKIVKKNDIILLENRMAKDLVSFLEKWL